MKYPIQSINNIFLLSIFTNIIHLFNILYIEFFIIGPMRNKIYNTNFMKKFVDEHYLYYEEPIKYGGYPDMGNGYYSIKLKYSEWYNFNKKQISLKKYKGEFIIISYINFLISLLYPYIGLILSVIYLNSKFIELNQIKSKFYIFGKDITFYSILLYYIFCLIILMSII